MMNDSSLSPTERKKLQRQRDKALGWIEITVKVAAEHADAVRIFAAQLPPPGLQLTPVSWTCCSDLSLWSWPSGRRSVILG